MQQKRGIEVWDCVVWPSVKEICCGHGHMRRVDIRQDAWGIEIIALAQLCTNEQMSGEEDTLD